MSDEFGFDDLRALQRKERNIASLAEVDPELYRKIVEYVNALISDSQESKDLNKIRLLENTVKVARDVAHRRMQKIVMRALKTAKTGEYSDKNMTPEEVDLYNKLVELLKEYNSFVDRVLTGQYSFDLKSPQPQEDQELEDLGITEQEEGGEMFINEEGQNIVLARVIKPIPRFVATDGKEYGPYDVDDIIKIPEEIANILGDQGLIEIL